MKRILACLPAAALMGALALPMVSAQENKSETFAGEVLDLSCYMRQGASGKDHAKCAVKCVRGGAPIGLLTSDGTVYVLVDNHKNTKPIAVLKRLAGSQVSVTGIKSVKGGVNAIIVEKAAKAK